MYCFCKAFGRALAAWATYIVPREANKEGQSKLL